MLQSAFRHVISFRTLTSPGPGRPSITDCISLMNKEKLREVISFAKSLPVLNQGECGEKMVREKEQGSQADNGGCLSIGLDICQHFKTSVTSYGASLVVQW